MPFPHSKLPSDTLRDGIEKVLQGAKDKPRKFIETIELQVGLKQYDPQKDKRFNGTVSLPTIPRPKLKLCMLGDAKHCEEAQGVGIDHMDVEALKKLNKNKKLIKKLAKVQPLPRLGIRDQADSLSARPRPEQGGQVPHAVHAQRAPGEQGERHPLAGEVPAQEGALPRRRRRQHRDDQREIFVNTQMSVNLLVSLLKKNWQNVKSLYIKSTMGAPYRLF